MDIVFNGVDAVTGQYLLPPAAASELAGVIKGEPPSGLSGRLRAIWQRISQPHLGFGPGVDPANLAQVGWGVVLHKDEDPAVKAAIEPLVARRRAQVGNDSLVKVFDNYNGESRDQWLAARGVSAGGFDPKRVPYYLLIVGSPSRMPFTFCHELDVEYGVGLLHFDTAAEYVRYVQSVIAYETGPAVAASKEAVFFGTRHAFDRATQLSADFLATPLADGFTASDGTAEPGVAAQWGFRSRKMIGAGARKDALAAVFGPPAGQNRPSLLFTASHGMGWPSGDQGQRAGQGALLCQDWPGVGQIGPQQFFAAADVPADAHVHGLVAFHFACFGAGTPDRDQYAHVPGQQPPEIAPAPFVAALPRALLAHPNGGALACIGHVERAWGYSIARPAEGTTIRVFQNALGRILAGQPVGYAMKDFNERFASLSVSLSNTLQQVGFGQSVPDDDLAATWTERNDAGGYLVIGDPAVRLRVGDLA